jgi:hypothetical protein
MLPPPGVLSNFASRSMDNENLLSRLTISVLAIYGENDTLVPYDEVARIFLW